ncbi:hypothetical protein AYO50_00220 [Acidobacteria bacterium SCGC AG-212-P17]|nr:hypothetical protein AYO50_00220 [Acidobacteria bacterium SCGC AG-212-P17]
MNALPKDIHNRKPVILQPGDYDLWLDPGMTDPKKIIDLLKPFDARRMPVYPVSSTVNKVGNDGAECAEESNEAPHAPDQPSPFLVPTETNRKGAGNKQGSNRE